MLTVSCRDKRKVGCFAAGTDACGKGWEAQGLLKRTLTNAFRLASNACCLAENEEAETSWSHSSSVISLTFLVDPLHIHLRKAGHQGALRTPVALEQLDGEAPLSVLRNPQLELAHTGDECAAVITRAVAEPSRCWLALRTQRLVHLGLQDFLHHHTDHFVQQNVFGGRWRFCFQPWSWWHSFQGGVEHHQPAMTAPLSEFAELSERYHNRWTIIPRRRCEHGDA